MSDRAGHGAGGGGMGAAVRGAGHALRTEQPKDARSTLRRLRPYFASQRLGLTLAVGCVCGATVAGLLGPYWMGLTLDRAVAQGDTSQLTWLAAGMAGSYVIAAGLQIAAGWLTAHSAQASLAALRTDLLVRLHSLPLRDFDRTPPGELVSRLTSDMDAIQQAAAQNVLGLFTSLFTMAGILAAMLVQNPLLALVAMVIGPSLLWFTRAVAARARQRFRELQRAQGQLSATTEETLRGQRLLGLLPRGESAWPRFERQSEAVRALGVSANTAALLMMPLTGALGQVLVVAIALGGGLLALSGLATVGTVATFIHYGQGFVSPLRQVANLFSTVQAALAGAERVLELLDRPVTARELEAQGPAPPATDAAGPSAATGHLRFDRVSFAYVPGRPALEAVSFEVLPGQVTAFVGRTGAGKTTIANLLLRFYDVQGGDIWLDGVPLRMLPLSVLRRRVGIVLQDTFLFRQSVLDNLRYGKPEATEEEVREAARLTGADRFIRQLPEGYATLLKDDLSHGQRQLLGITRTLLADPVILVLDEAMSGLDPRTEAHLEAALLHLMAGRTTLIIAHRLATIERADQVVVLESGRVVEQGSPADLMARGGQFAELMVAARR